MVSHRTPNPFSALRRGLAVGLLIAAGAVGSAVAIDTATAGHAPARPAVVADDPGWDGPSPAPTGA